ncbi:ATP-binding protein [Prochlorococcus marinus]|uniref:ATP-binding protein n=1 Tax=Prochlorococcus marinus XMU1408 TaxID=2213228 RepID=A0A318R5R3_PROMR|nr:ATP-binding protein [Prochlorococcus marinus]MBW3041735.1 ATP-binding protein [Prochlorococcus marinus str. XMU1408]PYE02881.1 ATP-binding protein [Prochlorococcus marinus XMU1408]
MESSKNWVVFIQPSTLKLAPFIETLLEPVICKETAKRIELGLHEALVNAVVHGNLSNPKKNIRVRRILTPNWFVWQIQDEGIGIVEKKRISSLPLEIDANSGRGIYLIHKCFDDVRWSRKGNRLQLSLRK